MKYTPQALIAFEDLVCEAWRNKEIKAPIHLYSNNETQMIEIFEKIRPQDWVFCSWRSHYQCLLKGVEPDVLLRDIKDGRSIALNYPEQRIFSSAIVAGNIPIATGKAFDIKRKGLDEKVYCFVGDMTAEQDASEKITNTLFYKDFQLNLSLRIMENRCVPIPRRCGIYTTGMTNFGWVTISYITVTKTNTPMLAPAKESNSNMKYFDELKRAMTWLGQQPDTFFLGQAVQYPGTAMTNTLKDVPPDKLWERPVCEDMQMGMSIGMALDGKTVPISIFPRWNFLLLATNQIVNHLDKITLMANNPYRPKVLIRVGIGSERPLHPQHQHIGDFTNSFRLMCPNINVMRLDEPEQIFSAYVTAYHCPNSSILVEWGDYYNEK